METGPQFKVSSDGLVKLGIEPATPGLQGKWLIHYTTAAPNQMLVSTHVIIMQVGLINFSGGYVLKCDKTRVESKFLEVENQYAFFFLAKFNFVVLYTCSIS